MSGKSGTDGISTVDYGKDNQISAVNNTNRPDEAYSFNALGIRAGWLTDALDKRRVLNDGTYQYQYDNEGNLTQKTEIATSKVTAYTWDDRNRLTRVTSGSQTVEYGYDAEDKRVSKKINGVVKEKYVYDGEDIALVVDATGTLVERYLYGAGVDNVLSRVSAGSTVWSLGDRQGSVVDEGGTVLNHFVYDSFGNRTAATGVDFRFGYTGRELDRETGLYYYRARYYDPSVGRFISEDPIGFGAGDPNLYRYVGNSPTNATDPSGQFAFVPLLGLMALGGVIAGTANVVHQGLEIAEGSRRPDEFSVGEALGSAAVGFFATPVLIVAPELGGLLAVKGAVEGFHNMLNGKPLSGAFDVATSIIPFVSSSKAGAIKSPRELTFGEGTWFSKFKGGESASWSERVGRLASEDSLKAWAYGTKPSSLDHTLSPLREQYPRTKWNIQGEGITEQEAHGLVGKLKDNAISKEQLDLIDSFQSSQGYKLTVNLLTEGLAKSTAAPGMMDGGGFYVHEPRILQIIRDRFPRFLPPSKKMRIDLHLEALKEMQGFTTIEETTLIKMAHENTHVLQYMYEPRKPRAERFTFSSEYEAHQNEYRAFEFERMRVVMKISDIPISANEAIFSRKVYPYRVKPHYTNDMPDQTRELLGDSFID